MIQELIVKEGRFKGIDLNKLAGITNSYEFKLFVTLLQPELNTAFNNKIPLGLKKVLIHCGARLENLEGG